MRHWISTIEVDCGFVGARRWILDISVPHERQSKQIAGFAPHEQLNQAVFNGLKFCTHFLGFPESNGDLVMARTRVSTCKVGYEDPVVTRETGTVIWKMLSSI